MGTTRLFSWWIKIQSDDDIKGQEVMFVVRHTFVSSLVVVIQCLDRSGSVSKSTSFVELQCIEINPCDQFETLSYLYHINVLPCLFCGKREGLPPTELY